MPNTNTIPAIITAQWLRSQGVCEHGLAKFPQPISVTEDNLRAMYVFKVNIGWFVAYLGCDIWSGRDAMNPLTGDIVYQPLADLRVECLANKTSARDWWHLACQTAIPFIISRVATP